MQPVEHSTLFGVHRRTATRVAAVCALLSLGLVVAEVGVDGLVRGGIMAFLPLPVYLALGLWLDRFEAEPARLLVKAFAWGAIIAFFAAMVINTLVGLVTGSDFASSVISAPVSEEIGKGLALALLFLQQRDEFDNVTDGIIYALMVGLGFAAAENVLYYGRAVVAGNASEVFVMRGVISPFAHPLFTAMTGIGLGMARESRRRALRLLYPAAGIAGAIALHSLWNLTATLGLFPVAYLVIMVPAFVAVLRAVRRSLRREANLLREHLAPYVAAGILPESHLDHLCDARARFGRSWSALRTRGIASWRRQVEYHQTASELAFHRWRAARGLETSRDAFAAVERTYADRLRTLHASDLVA